MPGLFRLLEKGETLDDLRKLSPEQILIRWVNYHLAKVLALHFIWMPFVFIFIKKKWHLICSNYFSNYSGFRNIKRAGILNLIIFFMWELLSGYNQYFLYHFLLSIGLLKE